MRGLLASLLALGLCATPGLAGTPAGRKVLDVWDVAYLRGSPAGHVHTVADELEIDGQKLLRTTVELRLKVRRNNEPVELAMDTGAWETPEGRVTGTFMRQYLGKTKKLDITGTVVGDHLRLKLDNGKPLQPAPWNDDVIGLYRQQTLFKDRDVKPGDTFAYPSFEPSINLVLNTNVAVKNIETVEMFGGRAKRKLLRVETRPDKIADVQLPSLTLWLDENRMPVRSEVDIPLLDKIVLYRTTKANATVAASPAQLTDIGLSQLIRLKRRIPNPYDTQSAVYRVRIRGDADPASAFARDERQQAKATDGDGVELRVRARRGPGDGSADEGPGAEFVQSSYFINSADPRVRQLASTAVRDAADPWQKAQRIEKWVNGHMRTTNHEALATADHVARTLEGDCTEFAMLTAAMCRAEGVPSRTATGLIYADVRGQPAFAFHMWTEVFVRGAWVPIDATLGKGYVGATHLKICDQSWANTRDLTPLFPVVRVLGRVSIDVVSVDGRAP
jgi:transglutaminase-like putative cysteine protease